MKRPSVRDGYDDETPLPYRHEDFWWHLDRSHATREIRALGRRLGIDVKLMTNEQIVEGVWSLP